MAPKTRNQFVDIWRWFMSAFQSFTKTALGLVAIAAAIVGWSVVILQDTWLDELENRVAAVDQKAAGTERGRPQGAVPPATRHTKPSATGETQLAAGQEALTRLQAKIDAAKTALAQLRTAVETPLQPLLQPAAPYRTLTRARVRAEPGTNTNEVAVVSAHQMIEVYETVEGGTWYKVRVSGYMFHTLVQPISEE